MNTRKIIVYGLIAVLLTLAFIACEQSTDNTPTLTGITADYTGGSVAINTDVNSLKSNLTVTAKYSDNTGKTLNAADYSLSGDLSSSGQKTVTVTYEGETTTFNVTVTAVQNNDITYDAIQTGGADGTTDSTGIVFTFSASVNSLNLTAANITVSGAAAKGAEATLTGTGTSRTLPITVNAAGLATVAIAKEGIEAVQKNVTIYKAGAYVPEYWSIAWHLNGGAEGTGAYPTQIVKGEVLDIPSPDPSKADNTFGGWYADEDLTQPYAFANPVTTDLNLYAKWVAAPTITPNNPITLTENQWADGSLSTSDDVQWFTFTAAATTQYIHVAVGTVGVFGIYVQVYDSSGETAGSETRLSSSARNTSRSLTQGETYYDKGADV